jgi:ABC-type Fe3+-citrate transport system substrate-binding protein
VNIRYPNITAPSEKEQLAQIKSYLHQLVDQLNYALPSMGGNGTATYEVQGEQMSYYDLRSLIMQQLQEVQTAVDELSKKFEKAYVKNSGWEPSKNLVTDANGNVVAVDQTFTDEQIAAVAAYVVSRISFSLDEEGNLKYEILEE